jgi:fermentation-respiration switch protein FrsA (DUF1100 family)
MMLGLLYFPLRGFDAMPGSFGIESEDLWFTTEDGQRLHGWWIAARGPRHLGHLLHFHGNAGNISHRLPEAAALAGAGFDVLLFDYRGYGRSAGRPDEQGTYRDARAARAALFGRPGMDARRVFYFGESLGGAIALALALEHPPAGLVLQSTFTSIRDMARLHYPVVPAFLVPDAYPSAARIGRLRSPLLVVHGDRDAIVPFSHGQALFAAAPERKRLHVVAGAGHNDLVETCGPAAYAGIIAGWARSLG